MDIIDGKDRILVWFSCGAASAVAAKMTIAANTEDRELLVVYCEVEEEHPDSKRFLKECEEWLDYPITIIRNEHYKGSIYNVFEKNYMRTPSGSPCTRALKKQVRERFQRPTDTHVFGYTIEEEERLNRFIDANNDILTFNPLMTGNITKENCHAMLKRAGIKQHAMYDLGFDHANCMGCVKGGMGYWNHTRKVLPAVFDRMAKFERLKGYTVLKEPKTGEPLYLDTLDPKRGRMSKEIQIECGIFCLAAEQEYK